MKPLTILIDTDMIDRETVRLLLAMPATRWADWSDVRDVYRKLENLYKSCPTCIENEEKTT